VKISAQDYEHICVLTVSGEFGADDLDVFDRVVDERLAAGARHMLLDCENLEFIDSAGLERLLDLRDRLGAQSGQVCLVCPDEHVAQILELTRLDRAFPAHPSVEAAVRSVR